MDNLTILSEHGHSIFWMIGIMILCNLAAIGAVITAAFKIVWWCSSVESRIVAMETKQGDHHYQIESVKESMRDLTRLQRSRS